MSELTKLWINDEEVEVDSTRKLMDVLRNDFRLKSVKDGCSEGACGTCMVIVDGKATKSCIMQTKKFEGKHIVTVEGLSEREKEVFVYAFGDAGAVQCGFCIPGMVISGKALIDVNPNPNRAEIASAIKNNICRCTGYKKIIDGIELAAKMLRENFPVEKKDTNVVVGTQMHRVDTRDKVLGTGVYVDDIDETDIPGMVYASAVRSKYPRAIVKSIDCDKAMELDGVVRVITAEDIPGKNKVGHLKQDWDSLIAVGDTTRYLGDSVAIVVARTQSVLDVAKKLVDVEYEELKPITCPEEAMAKGAPDIHEGGNVLSREHLVRGNADEVIANSKYKVSMHYETPWSEHAFLEPECAIAMPFDDGVYIYSTDQGTYDTRHEVSILLGLPAEKVIVENKYVGGGFGGKEDVSVQHHAALVAYLTGLTVKVKFSRKESMLVHPKRHAMSINMTTACDENGILTAMKAFVVSDTGAYASLGGPVLQRACTHAAGPYNYQVIDIEGRAVYTNNPPAGAFRGFGVTQTCFATERNIDLLAKKVGIDGFEMRYRNAIRPGDVLPNGQIADGSTGLTETLDALKDVYYNNKYVGIGCSMKNSGVGVGIPDWGRSKLLVEDGRVHIYAGASGIGQGLATVLTQVTAQSVGISTDYIVYHNPNTSLAPDSGTTSGSRQTTVTGEATRRAGVELRKSLFANAGIEYKSESYDDRYLEGVVLEVEDEECAKIRFSGEDLKSLEGKSFVGEYLAKTDKMGSDKENPVSHVAYGYATQVCVLGEDGMIDKIYAAHDVGKAVNPKSVEGQIEGGVVMSCGYALTEKYLLENCIPTAKFGTYGLFKADKTPDVVSVIVEKAGVDIAYGAIGVGEITSIPTPPAIAAAYTAYNGEFETELPLKNTPYARK
ncbi:MAG: selenium-dependent xanthine dehydrogenase [Clostridioides sp.]|nr:selenium-dependent xanthine dehydrogenase [Clostridioides sp.]